MAHRQQLSAVLAAGIAAFADDEDDILAMESAMETAANDEMNMILCLSKERGKATRVKRFLKETISAYSPSEFYSHFRMNRSTVEKIITEVALNFNPTTQRGCTPLNTKDAVLMSLWTLATTESFRQISDRFDISKSTCHNVFDDFCDILSVDISKYINWPTVEEMYAIANAFEQRTKFPGVIGSIDGCQIPIKKPQQNAEAYFNRKKFNSINLMAVVDHNMIFRDFYVGWPGSVHRNSPLHDLLSRGIIPGDLHLIGDSAFANSTSLLDPYKDNGHLTKKQKHFNKILSSTRVVVEQAFGLMKGKFRRVKTKVDVSDNLLFTEEIYKSQKTWKVIIKGQFCVLY